MDFAGFLFFSSLEYFSMFYLMLVMFRFELKGNLVRFGVYSLVLPLVSNTLMMESLQTVSPLIHIALYLFFFTFFLRIHLLNAAIMAVTGHVITFIVQTILIVMVMQLGLLEHIAPYTRNAFIIQSATAFSMFMIGLVTYLQKGGFSFIDNGSKFKRTRIFIKGNRLFIVFFTLSVIVTVWANLLFIISNNPPFLLIAGLLFVVFVGLLYTSMKRDGT